MRKTLLSLTVLGVACTGFVGMASAQGVDIDVVRGGVHVGPGYDRGHDHDWRWRHRETYRLPSDHSSHLEGWRARDTASPGLRVTNKSPRRGLGSVWTQALFIFKQFVR